MSEEGVMRTYVARTRSRTVGRNLERFERRRPLSNSVSLSTCQIFVWPQRRCHIELNRY